MQHLAVIMDGNRRWAKQRGFAPVIGHDKGKDAAERTMDFCIKSGIRYLSLYTFSLENFNRSQEEQEHLFAVLEEGILNNLNKFKEKGVRLLFIGDRSKFPKHLVQSIERAERETASCLALQVNILFCYGSQQELVQATRYLAQRVKAGELEIDQITEQTVQDALWTAGIPNPDLVIRTSGVVRLSNFLLYQSAYSELAFLDCLWPDITEQHLSQCVEQFRGSQRNFGA